MTGRQLWVAVRDGDAGKFSTLLSTPDVQSFINYQDVYGHTPLHEAVLLGCETVTKQLLIARCNVNLQDKLGFVLSIFRTNLGLSSALSIFRTNLEVWNCLEKVGIVLKMSVVQILNQLH